MAKRETRDCTFTATGFRRDDLEHMAAALAAMGVGVECEVSSTGRSARVKVTVPRRVAEARIMRTRLGGRKSLGIDPPEGSLFTRETPCKEFLAWQESHSAAEGMEQLGLSRSTYFRRMRAMRDMVEEYDRVNAGRDRSPEWKGKYRLVAKLGGVK